MRQGAWGGSGATQAFGVLISTWLGLTACGDTEGEHQSSSGGQGASANPPGGGGTSSGAPQTDADGFLEAQAKAYCARLFRCFEASDDFMGARLLLKTPAGCEAEVRKVNVEQPGRRDLQTQLAAGALHFNAAAAEKCLAELAACNGTDSFNEGSCREVYEGSARSGDACQRSEDCAGDAYCERNASACPGQCRPRKATGEPCEYSSDCSYSSGVVFCDYDALPDPVCRTMQLGPKAAAGEPCSRRLSGDVLITCNDELWCAIDEAQGADADQGRCAAPLKLGDACRDSDDVCADGMCDADRGVCIQPVLRSTAGETCDKSDLIVCDPTLGLRCNEQGSCDASGDGSQGSRCFQGDFQRGCTAGLYCATDEGSAAGTCQPWLATGAACTEDSACESGACETTCQARYCTL